MSSTETNPLHRRRRQIIDARFDFITNAPWMIDAEEYFGPYDVQSQLTDFYTVVDLPSDDPRSADAEIVLVDAAGAPLHIHVDPRHMLVTGDLTHLEHTQIDRRYSILGNTGLFFRYALATLQRHHGIVSMHASSFYNPEIDELLIVGGGTGAGKSVYLFESLGLGYQVFTAEMTFFKVSSAGITFYKGALHDNVWTGSIKGEYAHIIRDRLRVTSLEQRQNFLAKTVVDLTPVATKSDTIHNPSVLMLLSRVERDRPTCTVSSIGDPASAASKVYEVASEKLQAGYILYERYAAPTVDDAALQAHRFEACRVFVEGKWMRDVRKVVAGPSNCMEAIR